MGRWARGDGGLLQEKAASALSPDSRASPVSYAAGSHNSLTANSR